MTLTSITVTLDLKSFSCSSLGKPVRLSPDQFRILYLLMSNPQAVLSRTKIINDAKGLKFADHKTVDVSVCYIRKALGNPAVISTVRGFGYMFAEDVSRSIHASQQFPSFEDLRR